MARKRRRTTRKKSSGPTWLAVGTLCGLFLAFLLQLVGFWPSRLVDSSQALAHSRTAPVESPAQNPSDTRRPKYTFYETLPNSKVIVEAKAAPVRQRPDVDAAASEYFQLQAGSFTNAADAERRRADITLLGFSASISRAQLNNRDVVHRVTVGPFNSRNTVAAASNRLAAEGIDSFTQARTR